MARQQPLHQLVTDVAAPTLALSRASGDIGSDDLWPSGGEGFYHADRRVLAVARLTLNDRAPTPLAHHAAGDETVFSGLDLGGDDPLLDPQLRLDRRRSLEPGVLRERLVLTSDADEPTDVVLELRLGTDAASLGEVRAGDQRALVPHEARATAGGAIWERDGAEYEVRAPGAAVDLTDPTLVALRWSGTVGAHGRIEVAYAVACSDPGGAVVAAGGPGLPAEAITDRLTARLGGIEADDARAWLARSLRDLDGLRMAAADRPDDAFFAAGAPWYLTLFGRDSLWTARFLVDVDLGPAASTLRTLAARQGTRDDPASGEQPGKIMHELRRDTLAYGGLELPPLYFGTIDATALWVCLLVDAWRAGLPGDEVRALLPALRAALAWLTGPADADGDGFAEYADASGHGLANQGWKDSADAVRFADGTQAGGPVALCEVQGYAYEAATGAADLLEALGDGAAGDEPARLRAWAAALADRFRDRFWVERDGDRFVALALDGAKRPVDAVASNMGHLIGTGILTADEERLLADRLLAPDLASGLGLRTMATGEAAYAPLSYHCGSVWPHDTAIVIRGLRRAGLTDQARALARQLLRAARAWDDRLPEVYSGEPDPVPYPASCRPQAWSAAAAVVAVEAL